MSLAIHALEPAEYLGPMNGLGLITPEVTMPLGGFGDLVPQAIRDAIWHDAYVKMAIYGSILGVGGAALGYFASKKKKGRNAALFGTGGAAVGVGVAALIGNSKIKQAEAAMGLVNAAVSKSPDTPTFPDLPIG